MDYTLPARLLCPRNSKGKNTGVDDLPDPGIKPKSPALAVRLFTTSAAQEALCILNVNHLSVMLTDKHCCKPLLAQC